MNYTAVGDTVNIAARMEGLPSVFRTPIVVGEACARAAEDAASAPPGPDWSGAVVMTTK